MAVWTKYLRRGIEPTLADLADYTFQSVVFADGRKLEDVKFNELVAQVWTETTRNTATFTNVDRN